MSYETPVPRQGIWVRCLTWVPDSRFRWTLGGGSDGSVRWVFVFAMLLEGLDCIPSSQLHSNSSHYSHLASEPEDERPFCVSASQGKKNNRTHLDVLGPKQKTCPIWLLTLAFGRNSCLCRGLILTQNFSALKRCRELCTSILKDKNERK